MRQRNALLAVCLVAGCADQSTIPTTRPNPVPEHAHQAAASDVAPPQRWRSFWTTFSPQERAAGSRIIASVYAEGGEKYAPTRIAVVPGHFPDGVVALVTTNPLYAQGPILVISEQSTDYQSLALARRAAAQAPHTSTIGVLEVRSDGSTRHSAATPHQVGPRQPSPMVKDLEHRALRTVEVDLPGIGRGRLLEFF
jgi:hypothetical protein